MPDVSLTHTELAAAIEALRTMGPSKYVPEIIGMTIAKLRHAYMTPRPTKSDDCEPVYLTETERNECLEALATIAALKPHQTINYELQNKLFGWKPIDQPTPKPASIIMGDKRPEDCHFRLKDEGKPYPNSGCKGCGKGTAFLGKECTVTSSEPIAPTPTPYRIPQSLIPGNIYNTVDGPAEFTGISVAKGALSFRLINGPFKHFTKDELPGLREFLKDW